MRFSQTRFCLLFVLSFVLGLHLYFFHFPFPFPIRDLSSSRLVLQRLEIYSEDGSRSLTLDASAMPRQSSHGHRYLPSGINQLNARLLEASSSSYRLPSSSYSFSSPRRRVRGRYPADLPIINSIRLATPPWASSDLPRRSPLRQRAALTESEIQRNLEIRCITGGLVLSYLR